jgi:sn-glycerol 3-phosphate transport system substrate-binding protein
MVVLTLSPGLGCTGDGDGGRDADGEGRGGPVATDGRDPGLASCDVLPTGGSESPGEPGEPSEPSEPGEPGEPVEITFWAAEDGVRDEVLDALVDEFEQARPGVTVDVEHFEGGRGALLPRWRDARPGDRPSLALLDDEATRVLADSRQSVAPGACVEEALPGVVPAVAAHWSVHGVVQAVPYAVSTPVLVYDREAFAAAGLDPDRPPTTLDQVRAAARQVVDRGVREVGLAFDTGPGGGGSWFVEQWNAQVGALTVTPDNGHEPGRVAAAWDDGPTADHLAWLAGMVDDGLARTVGPNHGGLDDLQAVLGAEPTAAMTVHTSGSVAQLALATASAAPGGGRGRLGVGPMPGPGTGSLPGGGALWLAGGRSRAETRAAWSLAVHLASPRAQSRLAAETGYVPVTAAALDEEPLRTAAAGQPGLVVAFEVLAAQGTAPAELGMSVGPLHEVRELLTGPVNQAAGGASAESIESSLRRSADDADLLLDAYADSLAD